MQNSNMYFTVLFTVLLAEHISYAIDSATQAREYCLAPMNFSNCGLKPTPVFSYYKPGYTCVVAMWRGCPTKNKFHYAAQCSSLCQGSPAGEKHRCDVPLDTSYCTNHGTPVFTFDIKKQTCVEAMWYGCSPLNKFNDKQACVDACHNPNSHLEWTDKIKSLDTYLIQGLNIVLDELTKTEPENIETINKTAVADDNEIDKDVHKTFKPTPTTIRYVTQNEDDNLLTDKDGDVIKVMDNKID